MTVYYVSPTGSDSGAGTLGQPFGSLQYAHDLAQPGDEILLRGGTYRLSEGVHLTNDGTSGQPITVRNYEGEVPILDGSAMGASGSTGGYVLDLSGVAWNTVSGVSVTNGPEGGVLIRDNSHDNVIEQLDVSHNGRLSEWEGKGFALFDSSYNNQLLNNDSHDNRDLAGDNADGFQISTTGDGNVLRGNRAYNNSDDGFDLFNVHDGTEAAPVVLDGNMAYHNGYVDGNEAGGDGNGFKLGGQRPGSGSTSGGHTVTNNVAWDNRTAGFDENAATESLTLRNNTAYDNGSYNFGFYDGSHLFENNLSLGDGRVSASGTGSNNSWDLASPPAIGDVQSIDPSIIEGPRSADGSLPSSGFLKLDAGNDPTLGAALPTGSSQGNPPPTTTAPPLTPTTLPTTPTEPPAASGGGNGPVDPVPPTVGGGSDPVGSAGGGSPQPDGEGGGRSWWSGNHHGGRHHRNGRQGDAAARDSHDLITGTAVSGDGLAGDLGGYDYMTGSGSPRDGLTGDMSGCLFKGESEFA